MFVVTCPCVLVRFEMKCQWKVREKSRQFVLQSSAHDHFVCCMNACREDLKKPNKFMDLAWKKFTKLACNIEYFLQNFHAKY